MNERADSPRMADTLDALLADFEQNGIEAIVRFRESDRTTYLVLVAALLPEVLQRTAQAERGSLN